MFFRSLFYERTVLSLLEKVQRLPPNVQAEIAARVGKYINLARTAKDEASLARVATAAAQERDKVIAQGAKFPSGPTMGCTGACRGMVYRDARSIQRQP